MGTTPLPAKVVERKIHQPSDFSGDRLEASAFLNICRTYLRVNKDAYTDDEDKVIFVLSFMVGGTAAPWREAREEDAFTVVSGKEKGFGTFNDFVTEFKKAFEPLSPTSDAITKLKALKQTGLAEDYVALFRPLAARSGVKELEVLSDYFLSGLSAGLVRNILSAQTLPTDIEGYYTLAVRLDLQWRKATEYAKAYQTVPVD
ncbi:hypothetical protein DICSQDRAFT_176055, partial [Dichomitus squalens LYAD-421 SS1]